jgi:hypothetical protein
MVIKRKNAFIRQVKDITVSSALSLGLLAASVVPQACGRSEESYEQVYTKGVQTHIKEVDWGEFKITDEEVVGEGQSKAIVTYLDGRVDTLSVEEARRIVDMPADSTATARDGSGQTYRQHSGLSNVLLYGSLGYMMGRNMNQPASPGVYANQGVYSRAQQNTGIVRNSIVSRPTNASRGFFRSGSRGASS